MEGLFTRLSWCLAFSLLWGHAQGQSDAAASVHGGFEHYFVGGADHPNIHSSLDYVELGVDLSPTFQVQGSFAQMGSWAWVEETFLRYTKGANQLRFGRFRSNLGFANWSELYYTPMIALPMVRDYYAQIAPGLPLNRWDRGVEFSGGASSLQYTIGLVDTSLDDWQIMSTRFDTGIARVQTSTGAFMVGLNGVARLHGSRASQQRVVSADVRWTAPRLQIRAEAASGVGTVNKGNGYYVDVFYRPVKCSRTQLGARFQGFQSLMYDENMSGYGPPDFGTDKGQLCTLAARHFLNQHMALSLNYGFGTNIPEAAATRGWSVQLQSSMRF